MKKLVAYFSASGTTAKVAKDLAAATGADIYEIAPQKAYSRSDLDWTNQRSRTTVEMRNKSFRPELANKDAHIGEYDLIFLGFPIWWYVAPTLINSFLESYDFSNKKIVLFATSGGSGFGRTREELAKSVPSSAVIIEGKLFNGSYTLADLKSWSEKF